MTSLLSEQPAMSMSVTLYVIKGLAYEAGLLVTSAKKAVLVKLALKELSL